MGIIARILQASRLRAARKQGEAAGRDLAVETEEAWARMKAQIGANDDPATLKGRFLGWMQGFHGHLRQVHAALQTPEREFQDQWTTLAVMFGNRFRSEVLSSIGEPHAAAVLSDADIAAIATDVDAMVRELTGTLQSDKDELLDRAVAGIREAEAAGRLARDPRSDVELKESIREMWEAESPRD